MLRWGYACGAFLTMVAFWPWWEGGGLTTRWAALLILVPLALCTLKIRATRAHWAGAALLAWAALSLLWTPSFDAGVMEMMKLLLIGGCFLIGAEVDDTKPLYLGLAIGVSVSGLLAVAQTFGFTGVPEIVAPAGLFVNRNYLAEIGVVTLILALAYNWRWLILPLAAAALLPHSRGSLLALAVIGLLYVWRQSKRAALGIVLALIVAIGTAFILSPESLLDKTTDPHTQGSSLQQRLDTWIPTLEHLTLLGHGAGSFMVDYPLWTPHPVLINNRPAQAHNEIIHEASELGLPGIILLTLFAGLCLGVGRRGPLRAEQYALVAIAVIGLFSFPLHIPAVAAVAGVVAGRAARLRYSLCDLVSARGAGLCDGAELAGRLPRQAGDAARSRAPLPVG